MIFTDRDPRRDYQTRHGSLRVEIGRFSYGVEYLAIHEWGKGNLLRIGRFCSIAPGVVLILGGNHRNDWASTYPWGYMFRDHLGGAVPAGDAPVARDLVIGNDVWIGKNVTVMEGVTIGDGAVIAAGSHVARDVEAYTIAGGNPTRAIRPRFAPDITARLRALAWWNASDPLLPRIGPLLCRPPTLEGLEEIARIIAESAPQ